MSRCTAGLSRSCSAASPSCFIATGTDRPMCGICGQFNFGTGAPVISRDVGAMTATIAHRGPDDDGHYIAGPVGLGFRRLSIIDLAGGHQPMSDSADTVWV